MTFIFFVKYSKLFFIKKVMIQNHLCSLLQAYNYNIFFFKTYFLSNIGNKLKRNNKEKKITSMKKKGQIESRKIEKVSSTSSIFKKKNVPNSSPHTETETSTNTKSRYPNQDKGP